MQDGVPVNENFSYTFQGSYVLPPDAGSPVDHAINHTVEDFNNLGVAVWLQDDATLEIIQSTSATLSSVGIENSSISSNNFMLFPNPSDNITTVAFQGMQGAYIHIELVNLLGEIVYTGSYNSKSEFDHINIDVSTLNSGIYNLIFRVDESIVTKKLQILR